MISFFVLGFFSLSLLDLPTDRKVACFCTPKQSANSSSFLALPHNELA